LGALATFVAGARQKHIRLTWRVLLELAQAVAIVVLLFALLTEGRGCRQGSTVPVDESAGLFSN
jgi:hypothetical protein